MSRVAGTILRGVTAGYFQTAVSTVCAFVVTRFVVQKLGLDYYGIWVAATAWVSYLGVAQTGLLPAVTVRMGRALANGQLNEARQIATTVLTATAAFAGLASILVFAAYASGVGRLLFRDSAPMVRTASVVLLIWAAAYLLSMPLEVFHSAVRAAQRVDLEHLTLIAIRLASVGVAWVVLSWGADIIGFTLAQACMLVLQGAAFAVLAVRLVPAVVPRTDAFQRQTLRSLVPSSFSFLLLYASGLLIWGSDTAVISAILGPGAVASFSLTMRLVLTATTLIGILTASAGPTVTALIASGEREMLRAVVLQLCRTVTAVAALCVIGILSLGRELVRLWVGTDAMADAATSGVLLAVFVIRSFAMVFETAVVGAEQHRPYARIAMIEGILNLVLSIILGQLLGVFGVCLGTLIAQILCSGNYLPRSGLRIAGLDMRTLARSLMSIAPPVTGAALAAVAFSYLGVGHGWRSVGLEAFIIIMVFLSLFLGFSATPWERGKGRAILTTVRLRISRALIG